MSIYCKFCGIDITNKRSYIISLEGFADTVLCHNCYYNYKYPVKKKKVKYTPYTRWEIMDI